MLCKVFKYHSHLQELDEDDEDFALFQKEACDLQAQASSCTPMISQWHQSVMSDLPCVTGAPVAGTSILA